MHRNLKWVGVLGALGCVVLAIRNGGGGKVQEIEPWHIDPSQQMRELIRQYGLTMEEVVEGAGLSPSEACQVWVGHIPDHIYARLFDLIMDHHPETM